MISDIDKLYPSPYLVNDISEIWHIAKIFFLVFKPYF